MNLKSTYHKSVEMAYMSPCVTDTVGHLGKAFEIRKSQKIAWYFLAAPVKLQQMWWWPREAPFLKNNVGGLGWYSQFSGVDFQIIFS